MSVLQKLTEGVQSRDMQAEGAALLNKWEATGLLEGLNNGQQKQGMAVLLENQAKELLREASSMAAGDVEGFAAVAFPIVRRVFGGLIANDLISVQPMSLPSGLIFFLDFTHESSRAGQGAGSSLYGGGVVGKEIVDGVEEIEQGGFYGLGAGYGSANATDTLANAGVTMTREADPETKKSLDFDADLKGEQVIIAEIDAANDGMDESDFALFEPRNVGAIDIRPAAAPTIDALDSSALLTCDRTGDILIVGQLDATVTLLGNAAANLVDDAAVVLRVRPVRRLTKLNTKTSSEGLKVPTALTRFVYKFVSAHATVAAGTIPADAAAARAIEDAGDSVKVALTSGMTDALADDLEAEDFTLVAPVRDDINAVGLGALQAGAMPLEEPNPGTGNRAVGSGASVSGKNTIAEIDIKVDSIAVTAQTKKLKAKWSPELGQDLNAYHNLDAEVELTGILSEQIALEIDRELLGELVSGATAGTRYWSRAPGLFVDASGAELGARSAAPDFTGTVSEWYETLIETINDVSAQIHRKTLRGGANFVVCSPEVANILEFTSGFRASVTADQDRGTIGAIKAGSLSKKFDVYVDPYFLRNVILVGRKGSSFLESGYVYAPYVPLQVTPTIFGTEDFVPRKGVMTRYAKKMVRPDMYGLVVVRGLLGESGS